ncbi:hypothetical protein [Dyadobacter sp. BHUBP1]|uniref:hypothetical protein n=1 Tax=Dyadobacter sp. BHUBP1 TaxID=3424178 RepID=UPI003D32FE1A
MKRFLISAICVVTLTWACQKEDEKVAPNGKKSTMLTAEEQLVADRMGAMIPLSEFEKMKERFQKDVGPEETRAVSYGKTVLEKVLSQKGCVGIRFYFAKDKNGKQTLVFIGVDKNGKDITAPANAKTQEDPTQTAGEGPICPRLC